jgi:hypothetical protein
MKNKSWRTSLAALGCWTVAAVCLHWHITHHPGRWFFNMGEINDVLPQLSMIVCGFIGWHAKDKKSR